MPHNATCFNVFQRAATCCNVLLTAYSSRTANEMPPAATEDADGVTAELSSYINVPEGPLPSDVEAVKATFKQTISDDPSLARCPDVTRVDPRLWTSMRDSLKMHTKGDHPLAAKARELLRGVVSSITRRGSTDRSRAFRKKVRQAWCLEMTWHLIPGS